MRLLQLLFFEMIGSERAHARRAAVSTHHAAA
jgi:hypothetical protein